MGLAARVLTAALLCALVLGADVASAAQTSCVAPITCSGTQSPTLGEAVTAATDGDTIQVGDLALAAPLVISKQVAIAGVGGAPATMTFSGLADADTALTLTNGALVRHVRIALPSDSKATAVRLAGARLWNARVAGPVAVDAGQSTILNSLIQGSGTGNAVDIAALG
jgi:hypothetical protein